MLLSREEMHYDFGGAQFTLPQDRDSLGWIFSQFLYGEVTGIQVGHWIHRAPDLQSARFLAVQCGQELAHVRLIGAIFAQLGVRPEPAHRWVKFLATGLMGSGWEEHCCLEMALGEGYVLAIFYALEDTIPDPEIVRLLRIASRQEAMHVQFGEQQTQRAARDRRLRRRLLGMSLVSLLGMRRLSGALRRRADPGHPVWRQLPAFADHLAALTELRLQRLGLLDQPLDALPAWRRAWLATTGLAWRGAALLPRRRRLLTDTYLDDPAVQKAASRPIPGPARTRIASDHTVT
jgi:hypothetical protein